MGATTVIGLTGDVGSGKSAVRRWLEARGAAGFDADILVHDLLAGDGAVRSAVGLHFGEAVLTAGRVDRAALAARVFGDPAALAALEAILHPPVLAAARAWLVATTAALAVVEAVKLVEAGLDVDTDHVWLVVCPPSLRRQRLLARGWTAAEVERRMAAATPLAPRLARADLVVDNSGPWAVTERQIEAAWQRWLRPGRGKSGETNA